jgi:hypothetical protein
MTSHEKNNNNIAYAFAADVCVHAEERATRFRRPGTPGEERPRARGCRRDKLEGHGPPPLHDARFQLDLSAHLRLRRQSAVFGGLLFLGFFFTTSYPRAAPFAHPLAIIGSLHMIIPVPV